MRAPEPESAPAGRPVSLTAIDRPLTAKPIRAGWPCSRATTATTSCTPCARRACTAGRRARVAARVPTTSRSSRAAPTPRSTGTAPVGVADPTRPPPTSGWRASRRHADLLDDGDGARIADVAATLGVSADALRRDFGRVLGVSPKQYADGKRVDRLRAELRDGRDVTGALYTAGYSSSSRLYEQSDARLGMTPASYGAGGAGASIAFTVVPSPLGALVVATTDARRLSHRARCRGGRARGGPAPRVPGRHDRARRRRARAGRRRGAAAHRRPGTPRGAAPRRPWHRVPTARVARAAGASPSARPAATATWRPRSACRAEPGPWARRAGATRCRWWCPATGW